MGIYPDIECCARGPTARITRVWLEVTGEILTRCMALMLSLQETAVFTFKGARRLVLMPRHVDAPTGLMSVHKCPQPFAEGKN